VPAGAAALVLALLLVTLPPPAQLAEPSAIVNSFSGDVASVIIVETPESHQTIIWYTERALPDSGGTTGKPVMDAV
jgi:hypothetical protein